MIRRKESALAQSLRSVAHTPRADAIVSSALWAAAGDAVGWITELGDEDTIKYRTGSHRVDSPVEWRRRIGGRFGPTLKLPAGTYSDDTQLRLAVSRSTRGDGTFDVEAFAKVELPVWSGYSLGAGRGTTAAASNLTKSAVSWFSNFFGGRGDKNYTRAGGNGAAMRIQPHVWKSNPDNFDLLVRDVLRDAVTTHGHPKGFCGALFHAFCVSHALTSQDIPGPRDWMNFADQLTCIPEAIANDEQLSLFWLGPWEDVSGTTLRLAIANEIHVLIAAIKDMQLARGSVADAYMSTLNLLNGFDEQTRGAGLSTALASAALSYLSRGNDNRHAILLAANTPGSDTDTIATMAGAILGAARPQHMPWSIQDQEYIEAEAMRLARVALGEVTETFHYPDLISWTPPSTQIDAVGLYEDQMWLAGIGRVTPFGERLSVADAEWQWLRLDFGQTILAKRRPTPRPLSKKELPRTGETSPMAYRTYQPPLFDDHAPARTTKGASKENTRTRPQRGPNEDLDILTDRIIEGGFAPREIGEALLELAQGANPIERCTAFSAIIAKALEARRKRQRR